MYLLYIAIAIIVIAFVYSAITRRKLYSEIDRLEDWKLEISQRPIAEEISKVKGLKISGETEEKFESWRQTWDVINDELLADLEEDLFNIEELTHKYRFKKAKQLIVKSEEKLNRAEKQLEEMLADIDHLVNSEAQNRTDIEDVKKQYQDMKKYFSIHQRSFGKAAQLVSEKMDELSKKFVEFDEATGEGNYLLARTILNEMKELQLFIEEVMKSLPKLFAQFQSTFPADLSDLQFGIKEMGESGYLLEPFGFEHEIKRLQNECKQCIEKIERLELDTINEEVETISAQIEEMYNALEEEVQAKHWVESSISGMSRMLENVDEALEDLKAETELVLQSYRISEEELNVHFQFGTQLKELTAQLHTIEDSIENKKEAYTIIKKQLEAFLTNYGQLEQAIEQWNEKLATLRKEELTARETLKELKGKLLQEKRRIQKSNIPGIPQAVIDEMESGEHILAEAFDKLMEVPLEMNAVIAKMEEATERIEKVTAQMEETIELANFAEQIIQYGNRYRSRSDKVDNQLIEAELAFRSYYYEDAIEIAEAAIKPYEPNVKEKIKQVVEFLRK